jgi:hypothetical protein
MKATFSKVICAAAVVAGLVFSAQAANADSDDFISSLEGTWRVTVTQHVCTTGAEVGMPFKSLLSFAPGGTVTETTSNPMFFPAERGPGHGVWQRTGLRTFTANSEAFITVNGELTKRQIISQSITVSVDSSHLTSNATVEFLDPSGALLMKGCATAVAQRYE